MIVAVPLVDTVPLPAEVNPIGSVDEVYIKYVRDDAAVLVIVIDILGLFGDPVEPPPFVIAILETVGVAAAVVVKMTLAAVVAPAEFANVTVAV